MNRDDARRANKPRGPSVSPKADRNSGVPSTLTTIPLADPHARPAEPSIGDLIKDATTQVSTLVRAEVELARAEITRDVKKGLTGSVFFIAAMVVLFYSTFFFFFFLAEVLNIAESRGQRIPDYAEPEPSAKVRLRPVGHEVGESQALGVVHGEGVEVGRGDEAQGC